MIREEDHCGLTAAVGQTPTGTDERVDLNLSGKCSIDEHEDEKESEAFGESSTDVARAANCDAVDDESVKVDNYTIVRRQKRLEMNRESARNRRKRSKVLIRSLEEKVAELNKSNLEYQNSNSLLSSRVNELENELLSTRNAITALSNTSIISDLVPLQQSHLQSQQPLPQFSQQTARTPTFGQVQRQYLPDPMYSNQQVVNFPSTAAIDVPPSTNEWNIARNNDIQAFIQASAARSFMSQAVPNASGSRAEQQINQGATAAGSTFPGGSTPFGRGDNFSRLLQSQQEHLSMQQGFQVGATTSANRAPEFTPILEIPRMQLSSPSLMNGYFFSTGSAGATTLNHEVVQPNMLCDNNMININRGAVSRGSLETISQLETSTKVRVWIQYLYGLTTINKYLDNSLSIACHTSEP
jgi:hypothetical protein